MSTQVRFIFMTSTPKKLLILSGLDPTGNAGLLRDQATARFLEIDALAFPTAITHQTDSQYSGTQFFETSYFANIKKILKTQTIGAIKIGMLGNLSTTKSVIQIVKALKQRSRKVFVIWDPVLQSTSGGTLLTLDGLRLARQQLLPLVDLVTPNFPEALQLLNRQENNSLQDPNRIIESLWLQYQRPVYLKGGHLKSKSTDFIFDGKKLITLKSQISKHSKRGTGCLLATAIACHVLKKENLNDALIHSKKLMSDYFAGKISL